MVATRSGSARPTSGDGCGDAERIDRIALLDKVQAAAAAAQALEITRFAESQEGAQRRLGVSARRLGQGVAEQVALARKVSPATGARQVAAARALTRQMPRTFDLLARGEVSAWVATLIVRETSVLSRADRFQVDADLADGLPAMSPRQVEAAARRVGIELDSASAVRRGRTARGDRRVSIRPAPDTMALLTGFVPCEQGIAAWANLDGDARAKRGQGDPRSLGQIMADTFVERLTGQATAAAVPVEVAITMPVDSLLAGRDDIPARLAGYGPLPAEMAREVAGVRADDVIGVRGDSSSQPVCGGARRDEEDPDGAPARVFVRRVFTVPIHDIVVAVDARRRLFPPALARLFSHRDQVCRVPYCTAPIRHLDHIRAHRDGGPTTADNGQGLCERDSYVKEMPGWHVEISVGRVTDTSSDPHPGSRSPHPTIITTPTGHRYRSTAPPALGPGGNHAERLASRAERQLAHIRRHWPGTGHVTRPAMTPTAVGPPTARTPTALGPFSFALDGP